MVVLVAGKGQPKALDRIGDEAGRPVVGDGVKGVEHRRHVVAAEIGHQPRELGIVVIVENGADAGVAIEIALQMLAPALAALVNQCRIERVRAGVDPLAQMVAVGPGKGRLQQPSVFQGDDAPAHHLEHRVDAAEKTIGNDRVEALAVVIDDPPEIADVVLPAFEQRLEDVALVELGIAGERDHAAGRLIGRRQLLQPDIILRDRAEQGHADAEPDRTRRKIDDVAVLGARRVRLGSAKGAKSFQLVARLMAEQILDRVKDRRGVRFDRDTILRPQHVEIERRHQGRDRSARRLMAADLESVTVRAQVIGVVDHPGRQPQHLALERGQARELVVGFAGCSRPSLTFEGSAASFNSARDAPSSNRFAAKSWPGGDRQV